MMVVAYLNGKHSVSVNQRSQTNIRVLIALAFGLAIAIALLFSTHTFAEDVNNAPNTLRVTPVRSDVQIAAGSSGSVKVTISNLTNSPITVHPIENDFTAGDESGTPALILDENEYAPTHSLKRFMTPLSDVTIPANDGVTLDVIITVPAGAQAGGYFGALRFAPTSPEAGGQVNLSASVASLILLTVPGDTVEKLELTDFEIQQNGKSGTNFRDGTNLQTTFRFENKGNVQVGPFGKITVTKNGQVVHEVDFNDQDQRDVILPDSARRWDVPLENIEGFGHYTVYATLTYGSSNQTVEISKSFWVIPVWVMIVAAAVLLVIAGIVVAIIFGLRSRRRRIVRSMRRR